MKINLLFALFFLCPILSYPLYSAAPDKAPFAETVLADEMAGIIADTKIVIVDFYGAWCGPCRHLLPIFERLAEEYASEEIRFLKVNIGILENRSVLKEYNFSRIPTVIFFRDGEEFTRCTNPSEEELHSLIHEILESTPIHS